LILLTGQFHFICNLTCVRACVTILITLASTLHPIHSQLHTLGDFTAELVALNSDPLYIDTRRRQVLMPERVLRLDDAARRFGCDSRVGVAQLMDVKAPNTCLLGEFLFYYSLSDAVRNRSCGTDFVPGKVRVLKFGNLQRRNTSG
jgi:hypothetical protein